MSRKQSSTVPVSVIICSRNRPRMLAATIDSILDGQAIPAELIIIDQSDRPNVELAGRQEEKPEFRYMWTRTTGLSTGNNIGAAVAQCEIVAFTHDDVFVAPTWLQALVQTLAERGPGVVVTGRVLAWTEDASGGFAPALKTDTEDAVYGDARGIGMLKPLNMAIYRSALRKIGGFDARLGPGTRFPGAEDSDLGFRLLRKGFRLVYVPKAVVYHRAWRAKREYLPLRWRYGIAQGAFYAKHLSAREPWILGHIWWDLRRRTRRFPRRLWQERHRAMGDPLFLLGNMVGAGRWLLSEQRRRSVEESLQPLT